jgi:hypothetical protein
LEIMKKKILLLILPILLLSVSCKKYIEGYSVSPNLPSRITHPLRLSVCEVATIANYTGNLARVSSLFMQETAGQGSQYLDFASYAVNEGDIVNDWAQLYSDALVNCQELIDSSSVNPYYTGMAKVLKAMNLGLATDLWGDVPNREAFKALQGEANFHPHYDAQQTIISDIQDLLSSGIADLGKPASSNIILPATDDYIFQGNTAAWIKAAWVLKARYANRLSKRDPSGSASNALQYLKNSGMTSDMDDMNAVYGTNSNELNPWAAFQSTRAGYFSMGSTLIDMMNANSDPRRPFYAVASDSAGNFTGSSLNTRQDSIDLNASVIGPWVQGMALPLVTYFEAKFIEAEANLRTGNTQGAADAYNTAVQASVEKVTGASIPASFKATTATATSATITLKMVMTQKYIAMFTQPEVWSDWRRTNIPYLRPDPTSAVPGVPRRLPTSIDERTLNNNAKVDDNLLSRVWWDQ